jgi:arsenite methyltransferase
MRAACAAIAYLAVAGAALGLSAQAPTRNVWADEYKTRTAEAMAAQFESEGRAVYRYRVAIAGLLQLKSGMTAAEIGAGSGFLARVMAAQVGSAGRVIATELDPKMVEYMNARASKEGIGNFSAIQGRADATGLQPASVDAIAIVNTLSFVDKREAMLASAAGALKPGGALLVVDFPLEGVGPRQQGIDAEDVIALAAAAGLRREAESGVVPGHYAIRFRKP